MTADPFMGDAKCGSRFTLPEGYKELGMIAPFGPIMPFLLYENPRRQLLAAGAFLHKGVIPMREYRTIPQIEIKKMHRPQKPVKILESWPAEQKGEMTYETEKTALLPVIGILGSFSPQDL